MSIAATVARVAELQALLAGSSSPTGGASAPAGFAGALADATAAGPGGSTSGDGAVATASSLDAASGTSASGLAAGSAALELPAAAGSSSAALPASVPYSAQITAAARRHGIDPALLAGLIRQESGFNANAVSPAGARGLTQLMPATAAGLGVSDPSDPAQAIEGGAKYLAQQLARFHGDIARALAAYNAGPNAVERFGGVPPYAETQAYVRRVQSYAAAYRAASTA